ncbi:Gag-Pol poly [Fusarium albosuccineum]|uniref:Gag-Pol poly n=1 Tax=Fusarium albosuccineum TaxID=1237068 RepID=A0A8H4L078_9HYPO|nr:Gag-Pol poly [Fusarium albosuccineum]
MLIAQEPEPAEPKTHRQAKHGARWSDWLKSMEDELHSLDENSVWDLVYTPKACNPLQGKWEYKLKRGSEGEILRHKSRLVVRGFEQCEGISYHETFAFVVKPMSYKAIFAIAAALDVEIEQIDVKTAFLYRDVDEEIYLKKALYGVEQAPRIWYQTDFLSTLDFQPLGSDVGVFIRDSMFIAVYVDDLLIVRASKAEIQKVKDALSKKFHMTDLGPCRFYLGMAAERHRQGQKLFLSRKTYLGKIIREVGMHESTPFATPVATDARLEAAPEGHEATKFDQLWYARAIESLMYAMLGTRPDIAFAVSLCSRSLGNPTQQHIKAVRRIFKYLEGIIDYKLCYCGESRCPFISTKK